MSHRLLSLIAVLVLAVPLFAAPSEGLIQDATAYAAEYGVSVNEAVRRLELQRLVADLDGALTAEEAGSFAGLWIQHKPEYRVIVRFTNRTAEARLQARVAGTPLADVIETRNARWSVADLEKRQQDVRGQARKAALRLESDVNIPENKLEVYALDPVKAKAKGVRLPEGAELKQIAQHSVVDELLGGNGLYDCTAGFGVRSYSGELGISTAAHCSNTQYFQGYYLPFRAEKYSGDQDVQWNSTCDIVQVSNRINSGIGTRSITQTRSRTNQTIGTYVCKYGMGTGRTCGTIQSKSYDLGANFNATFIRVDGYQLRGPGDSGGPWFVEDVAYGIHHGAPGSDLNDALYMAINYISAIGVSVLTYDPGPNCNLAPVADFSWSTMFGSGWVEFDASASYDPDGYIVSYFWDFGDGWTETTTTPYTAHGYEPGNYHVTLTVTDNEGLTSGTSWFITLCSGGGGSPIICPQ